MVPLILTVLLFAMYLWKGVAAAVGLGTVLLAAFLVYYVVRVRTNVGDDEELVEDPV